MILKERRCIFTQGVLVSVIAIKIAVVTIIPQGDRIQSLEKIVDKLCRKIDGIPTINRQPLRNNRICNDCNKKRGHDR